MMKQFFLLTVLLFSSQFACAVWPFKTVITIPSTARVEVNGIGNNIKAYCFWKYIRSNNKKFDGKRLFELMNSFNTKY